MTNKYRIKISGKDVKRFIRNLISMGIQLYDIDFHDKYVYIIVDEEDLERVKKIKTSYSIKIVDQYGLVKLKHLSKKYFWFIVGLFIGLILLKILSSMIFSIEVMHSKSEIRELVLHDLEQYGISKYHFKVSFSKKEKIIKEILHKETDRLEWLEIETVGTKYVVKVEERVKNKKEEQKESQNIIAKKNARILEIHADSGEVVTKKNDYVSKGDVLISGFIHKNEEIKKKVHASGTVFGEVWYNVSVTVPKTYKEVKEKSGRKNVIEINFLNYHFTLFDLKKFKTYKADRKVLLKNNLLPISVSYSKLRETEEIFRRYDTKEGENEAIKMAEDKLSSKLSNGEEIISKKVLKKIEKDSTIIIDVFFKVKEDITDYENIENIDISNVEGDKNGASQ